jgi:hypothetical protein
VWKQFRVLDRLKEIIKFEMKLRRYIASCQTQNKRNRSSMARRNAKIDGHSGPADPFVGMLASSLEPTVKNVHRAKRWVQVQYLRAHRNAREGLKRGHSCLESRH